MNIFSSNFQRLFSPGGPALFIILLLVKQRELLNMHERLWPFSIFHTILSVNSSQVISLIFI